MLIHMQMMMITMIIKLIAHTQYTSKYLCTFLPRAKKHTLLAQHYMFDKNRPATSEYFFPGIQNDFQIVKCDYSVQSGLTDCLLIPVLSALCSLTQLLVTFRTYDSVQNWHLVTMAVLELDAWTVWQHLQQMGIGTVVFVGFDCFFCFSFLFSF